MAGVYYFGPLGRLQRMPVPSGGFDDPPSQIGAVHTAVNGTRTKDLFATKRSWVIPFDGMTPEALSFFALCAVGAVSGPYYMVDDRKRNRLSAQVSGMAFPQRRCWTPSTGTVAKVAAAASLLTTAIPTGVQNMPAPSFACSWTTAGAGTLLGDADRLIPVMPGDTMVFSCYVQAGAPSLELVPYNAALVAQPVIAGTVVQAGEVPPRRYVLYTVPVGIVAVRPQLRVAGAGTVITLAWQLGRNTGATNPVAPYVLGTGAPAVLIDQMDEHADLATDLTTGSLSLLEV